MAFGNAFNLSCNTSFTIGVPLPQTIAAKYSCRGIAWKVPPRGSLPHK